MIITNVTGNYFLKQNDTATDLTLKVTETDGSPVPLDTAPRVEIVIGTLEGRMLVKEPTSVSTNGELTFGLDEGDRLPTGDNLLEVHIYTVDGEKRVAPSKGHYKLKVQQAIDELDVEVTTYTLDYFLGEVNRITYGLPELMERATQLSDQVYAIIAQSSELVNESTLALQQSQAAKDAAESTLAIASPLVEAAGTNAERAEQAAIAAEQATSDAITATEDATISTNAANIATQQANDARDNANTAASLADGVATDLLGLNKVIEDFSLAKTFIKHQPARFNGSTYRAKKETIGNTLPVDPYRENEWWTLEAQRGVDGEGAVASVNGVLPDVNGNVELTIPASDWSEIPNKPVQFQPTVHEHTISDIADLQDASLVDKGLVKLETSVISESETTAATPKSVKQVNSEVLNLATSVSNLSQTVTDNHAELTTHLDNMATETEPGHVKVDGVSILIDENGVISSVGGSGVEFGDVSNITLSSNELATLVTVNWTNPTATEFIGVEVFTNTSDITNSTIEYCQNNATKIADGNISTSTFSTTHGQLYYVKVFAKYDAFDVIHYAKGVASNIIPQDVTPPNPITNFKVDKEENQSLTLSWTNPTNTDFNKTRVLYKIGSYPTSEMDGTIISDSAVSTITVNGLTNDTTYYFRAFTFDNIGNINKTTSGQQITGVPSDVKIYGVKIDTTNTNPSTALTYTDNATGFTPASGNNGAFTYGSWQDKFPFNEIYPCMVKDGVEIYKLNPNNYAQKLDGSAADISSGNDGDVMVRFPKIWWKFERIGNDLHVRYANAQVDSGYKALAHLEGTIELDEIFVSAYLGFETGGKLRSLSGKTPTVNKTISAFRTLAQANGTGYEQMLNYPTLMLQVLYIVMFKSRDSQTALGRGYVDGNSAATLTGGANAKGLFYGENTGKQQMKFCGIEDWYGNVFYWLDGLVTDASRNMLIGTQNFNDVGTGYVNLGQGAAANLGGYISDVQGGTETGFIAKNTSGSETTHYADSGALHDSRVALFGSSWAAASAAGAFYLQLSSAASSAYAYVGARLLCR